MAQDLFGLPHTPEHATFVDLFAGAGGFGLGFSASGFTRLLSLELDGWAADTLRTNGDRHTVVHGDIRDFRDHRTIKSLVPNPVDVVIGGPPCQGFSVAGPASKDPNDPRNSLFLDFANWVRCLEPHMLLMENVKGLLSRRTANGLRVIDVISDAFRDLGYVVEVWHLNAAAYGVPQMRERIFIVGHRLGRQSLGPPPPTHTLIPHYGSHNGDQLPLPKAAALPPAWTLWQAISDLPELGAGQGKEIDDYLAPPENDYQRAARDGATHLYNHVAMRHSERLVERFRHVGWGESSANVPTQHRARRRNGGGRLADVMYSQNNRRLHPDRPSHTIAASFYANFIHPYQHRNLTAREGARLQSFPDWYRFKGKKTVVSHRLLQREERHDETFLCQYSQIGNAVPPLLAHHIANYIREVLRHEFRTRGQLEAERRAPAEVSGSRKSAVPEGDQRAIRRVAP